jgi:hypothetical protein
MADVKRLLWSARNKKSGYSKIPSLAVGKKKWLHTKQNQGVQKKSQKISTQLLTVLIIGAIVQIEQRRREIKEKASDPKVQELNTFANQKC